MGFKKNVGLIDRIFRAAFGTGFVAYGLLYLVGVPSMVAVLVGVVLLATAFTGSCFIYSLLGINTRGNPYCDVEKEEHMPEVEELMMAEKMPPVEMEKPKVKAKKPKKARRKRRRKKR